MKTSKTQIMLAIKENVKEQYLNEYTTEKEFRKLNDNEKILNLAEYAATEYFNTTKVIDAVLNGKKKSDTIFNGLENKLNNTEYFKDLDRSKGDISKTEHYQSLNSLLYYGMEMNTNSNVKNNYMVNYDEAASSILNCIKAMESNKHKFKALIESEKNLPTNRRIATSFYKSTVFLLQMAGDLLYSNSIEAKFNYNVKPPAIDSITFAYSSGILDDILNPINELTVGFRNGKVFKTLDTKLQEDLGNVIEKITLQEDVLDTIFGLTTHFKTIDLFILFPIYLTRSVLYWMGFFYLSFRNISLDIERSISVTRSRNMDVNDYNTYKNDSVNRAHKASIALSKAGAAIDMDVKSDKQALVNLKNTSQNAVLI